MYDKSLVKVCFEQRLWCLVQYQGKLVNFVYNREIWKEKMDIQESVPQDSSCEKHL